MDEWIIKGMMRCPLRHPAKQQTGLPRTPSYHIISCHIVDLKRQNRLKIGTDKSKLKVKMQSVSDDDVRKRFLEKPRFELAANDVFRLEKICYRYILRQGIPCLSVSDQESLLLSMFH